MGRRTISTLIDENRHLSQMATHNIGIAKSGAGRKSNGQRGSS